VGPTACLKVLRGEKNVIKQAEERYDEVKHKQKPMQIKGKSLSHFQGSAGPSGGAV